MQKEKVEREAFIENYLILRLGLLLSLNYCAVDIISFCIPCEATKRNHP